jgi:hypothetical protein
MSRLFDAIRAFKAVLVNQASISDLPPGHEGATRQGTGSVSTDPLRHAGEGYTPFLGRRGSYDDLMGGPAPFGHRASSADMLGAPATKADSGNANFVGSLPQPEPRPRPTMKPGDFGPDYSSRDERRAR